MKFKIIILMILIIISINNVYCETDSYSIEYQYDNIKTLTGGSFDFNPVGGIYILDINTITDVSFFGCYVPASIWAGGTQNSNFSYANLYSNSAKTNYIGRGIIGYIKDGTSGYRAQLHILSLDWGSLSGSQGIFWIPDTSLDTIATNIRGGAVSGFNGHGIWSSRPTLDRNFEGGCIHTTKIKYQSFNDIEYFYNKTNEFFTLSIFRNTTYPTKWYVKDAYTIWKNETTLQSNNESIYSYDIDNCTWDTHVTTNNDDIINLNIDFCSLMIPDDETQPTLTTDKIYYNTSEIIDISFTNINTIYNNCVSSICAKPYELHILYPVTDEYKQYESKYIYPLTYLLEDETISLNTSFLSPQNTYILGIVGINGDYTQHDNILLFSDSFTVYPDNEYLSVSCDSESSCYTYNNADITIYYKINNNSDIIIKDNDNNIINTYHNIIDSGELLYHIPDDLYHINKYPNWKIYLNNTGYSTSFNKGVTVYWSQFQTPTPTPTYTPSPTPDINISDTIDEFKTETQPIKDLIFGLSEIIIDNPDYNKDNIVDESEINHWFNSLIPICIIFLLVVLYIGLKKKRE